MPENNPPLDADSVSTVEVDDTPVQTDNRPRPEDGPQDLPQEATPFVGDADDVYDPDRDGIAP